MIYHMFDTSSTPQPCQDLWLSGLSLPAPPTLSLMRLLLTEKYNHLFLTSNSLMFLPIDVYVVSAALSVVTG